MQFARLKNNTTTVSPDDPSNKSGLPVDLKQPAVFEPADPKQLLTILLDILARPEPVDVVVHRVIMEVDRWEMLGVEGGAVENKVIVPA